MPIKSILCGSFGCLRGEQLFQKGNKTMTIKEIVTGYLEKNNFDGLCYDDCGCELKDLMPCDQPSELCTAGYKVDCPGPESCPADGDCPWHIIKKRKSPTVKRFHICIWEKKLCCLPANHTQQPPLQLTIECL